MAKPKESPARPRRPLMDRAKLDAVMEAISEYDITSSPSWSDLDALSSYTEVDEIEAIPEGIFETDEGFSAAATVYVLLSYGDKNDEASIGDTFPAQVEGHFEKNGQQPKAIIDSFSVDTSSFYE